MEIIIADTLHTRSIGNSCCAAFLTFKNLLQFLIITPILHYSITPTFLCSLGAASQGTRMMMLSPWVRPPQMAATPSPPPRLLSSYIKVMAILSPDAPTG